MPPKTQESKTATKKTKTVKKATTEKKISVKKSTTTKKSKAKSEVKTNKNLLIVESPAKAKTIKKYLGEKYEVLSCKGHIRDLPASRLGVDIENEFKPEYIVSRKDGKTALIKELKAASVKSQKTYLATDPDREGEAIAWHLANVLGIDENDTVRVTFNEITKNAVTEGISNPRTINMSLFNAQQARRVLDRLVGYKISPFLWKKVKKGLSAGRVQSVATRLVVDREREIEAFLPVEYWLLEAVFENGKRFFNARFYGNKDGKMALENKDQTDKVILELNKAAYVVDNIKKQERLKSPNPPFITSSLQQDASVRLNMRPQRTMSIAQILYEGIDIKGHGLVGLITYMRTDSLRISDEAQLSTKNYLKEKYGEDYIPKTARIYKTKKNSQDAHEAIRPTDVNLTPEL
ncbi:MAG: topoisomerase, partial [Clostridia bacterium]|nr:topoisomerase [Clostridia bacterium]